MSGFDRLGRELESAAARERRSRWPRNAGGAVVIAGGVAAVVVVAVAAVVLLRGRTAPTRSAAAASAQPAPPAQAAVWSRLLRCRSINDVATTSKAAPPRALVAELGVLRASWTTADAAPAGTVCTKKASVLLLTPDILYTRYVRYVGPGVHGGQVFLVPAEFVFRLPPGLKRMHLHLPLLNVPRRTAQVCVFTLGAGTTLPVPAIPGAGTTLPVPANLGDCTSLADIERPAGAVFAPPSIERVPRGQRAAMQRLCVPLHGAARKRCLANARELPKLVPFPPQTISGVVRDGIASVDVYARVKGARKLVLDLPIQNNVYSFESGGAVTGILKLVFRNAAGQVVRTTRVPALLTTVAATVNKVVGERATATIPLIAPPPSSASQHTAGHRRR